MKKRLIALILISAAAFAQSPGVGVRILLGVTDREPNRWDGGVVVRGAEIRSIEPWRFEPTDSIAGSSWKISTNRVRLFGGGGQMGLTEPPVVANGVIVRLSRLSPDAALDVTTSHGNFSVRLADLTYGKMVPELNGGVSIDLTPPVTQITSDPQEQDHPAATAAKDGAIWLAYTEFIHHKDHDRLRANMQTAPPDFAEYQAPTGGDRVVARSYRNGSWGPPIEISAGGGDVNRPAIAIDASGRVWIIWSANEKGNFDIWARPIENNQPGAAARLSCDAGADLDPVAATDSKGAVWVAWQAWRNGRAAIMSVVQTPSGFSQAKALAAGSGNQWNPAIAADANGRVTIAWDAYENGNYDVMMRTAANGAWGKVIPVAATARYEAYPSIAYDPKGRLWVAYEEGAARWGKDFGAQDSTGIAVYQGRAIRLRGFESDGRAVTTQIDPGSVITGPMSLQVHAGRQSDSEEWLRNDPKRAVERPANRSTPNVVAPKNTLPRLAVDASGRIWLAYRSVTPVWWNPLGTVWTEYLASYDGAKWTGPVYLSHSDNLLDNRPALVSKAAGELAVIGSSRPSRRFYAGAAPRLASARCRRSGRDAR